jgi:hypothetical protein
MVSFLFHDNPSSASPKYSQQAAIVSQRDLKVERINETQQLRKTVFKASFPIGHIGFRSYKANTERL